ncbi:hypothetical protein ACFLQ2_02760 [archaeon]
MQKEIAQRQQKALAYWVALLFRHNDGLEVGEVSEMLNKHFKALHFDARSLKQFLNDPPRYVQKVSGEEAEAEYNKALARFTPSRFIGKGEIKKGRAWAPRSGDPLERVHMLGVAYKVSLLLRDKQGLGPGRIAEVLAEHFGEGNFSVHSVSRSFKNPPGYADRITDAEARGEYAKVVEKTGIGKKKGIMKLHQSSDSIMAYQLYHHLIDKFGWGSTRTQTILKKYTGLEFKRIHSSVKQDVLHPKKDVASAATALREKMSLDLGNSIVVFELVKRLKQDFGCGNDDAYDVLQEYSGNNLKPERRTVKEWRGERKPPGYKKGVLVKAVIDRHLDKIFSGTSLKKKLLGYHVYKLARDRIGTGGGLNYEEMLNEHFGSPIFVGVRFARWAGKPRPRGYKQRIPDVTIEREYNRFLKTHKDKLKK